MNRIVITACLPVLLCCQVLAQQSTPPAAAGQQGKPQTTTTKPQTSAATQPGPAANAPATKKKHSAAKKKASPQAEPAPPAPAPVVAAPTPPPAPAVPPTLMNQAPVSPTVTLHEGLLTIDAPNSTLSEVLSGVRRATGAVLEGISPSDRVAVKLGPGSPREVVAALLQGTPYDYLILGSDHDPDAVTRILLSQGAPASEPTATAQPSPPVIQPPPAPENPEFFPEQGSVPTGTVIEGEQPQPPNLPPQPPVVNPNQPWLTMPQNQPGAQPVQPQQPPQPQQSQ